MVFGMSHAASEGYERHLPCDFGSRVLVDYVYKSRMTIRAAYQDLLKGNCGFVTKRLPPVLNEGKLRTFGKDNIWYQKSFDKVGCLLHVTARE